MGRLKYYARALLSGYLALGVNVAYTLGSVPLALRYLSNEEFGLWALTSQLAGYVALLELGMSGAAMRILIDFKDRREETAYGSTILTGLLVNAAQSVLILIFGIGLAFLLGSLLDVPPGLMRQFRWLMIGQTTLTGVGLAFRTPFLVLSAHQRYDLLNVSQAIMFTLGFAVLWWCFASGVGIFSMFWALAAAQGSSTIIAIGACVRLRLLPREGLWGRPSWERFWDLFAFGRDMLMYSVGNQLITASQTILLTRMLGLQAAATWSICTRAFTLTTQVIFKIFDYACAALAEMIVRQEKERLLFGFRSMIVLSGSLSVAWRGFSSWD